MHHLKTIYATATSLCCALFLGGCGLDDDTNYLSGTVAASAPLIGTVTIKDSSVPPIEKSVTIGTDGTYIIEVPELIAPLMLRADGVIGGRAYSLYSAATASDVTANVNVTPFTDLIVANAVYPDDAQTFYFAGAFDALTPANLDAAETNLQMRLQPILDALNLTGNIDFLRTPFDADHTGLDAVLDILRVTSDPFSESATIKNVITGQTITDDFYHVSDFDPMDITANVAARVADFQQIAAVFDSLSSTFAASPLGSGAAILFDNRINEFLNDGRDLPAYLTALASDDTLLGAKFTNVVLESFNSASTPTVAKVRLSLVRALGHVEPLEFTLNKVGSWKIAGNKRIAKTNVSSFAHYDNNNGITATGLALAIEDLGSQGIDYAIVTGSGLTATQGGADGTSAGLLLFKTASGTFQLAASGVAYAGAGTTQLAGELGQYPISDDGNIQAIADNDTYTVKLYDDNNTFSGLADLGDDTLMATYNNILIGKPPYSNSELAFLAFASISTAAPVVRNFADTGGSLTLDWTLPAGLRSSKLRFWRSYSSSPTDEAVQHLSGNSTQATVTINPPADIVVTTGIDFHARDVFNREIITYTEY